MTTDENAPTAGGSIHRLLDEAFAGIEPTADVQDLKEEIRFNLSARADELERSGLSPADAARRAVEELGDVRELVAEVHEGQDATRGALPDHLRYRVRPRPSFVVRTVVLSLVALAGLTVIVLDAFGLVPAAIGWLWAVVAAIALTIGVVTADALRQETTTNYPLPTRRAIGFGGGTGLILAGLGVGWLVVQGLELSWLVLAALLAVGGIVLLSYLGATKTNRHKPWVLHQTADFEDRFTQDPVSAARFGIYTAAIWVVAFTVFVVLSFTVGWAWSWLALVGGFVLMLTLLARMLFPPKE